MLKLQPQARVGATPFSLASPGRKYAGQASLAQAVEGRLLFFEINKNMAALVVRPPVIGQASFGLTVEGPHVESACTNSGGIVRAVTVLFAVPMPM